jgi:eight-cysteine-cluster-containing protein
METRRRTVLVAALGAAALFAAACSPTTDRDRYQVGDEGTVTLRNQLSTTLFLGGCNHFDYEKRVGGEWVSQGPDHVCVWEGIAQPVAPGATVTDPIFAREPGTWRLHYQIGVGCREGKPLGAGDCRRIFETDSNEFTVVGGGCIVAGCSGELCVDAGFRDVVTPCVWLPQYECLEETRCGPFGPGGACGWERTPEFEACLEEVDQADLSVDLAAGR